MKIPHFLGLFIASSLIATGSAHADAGRAHGELVLTVTVERAKGRVLCGIYERGNWLKKPLKGSVASIRGTTAACRFSDLKPGTYAAGAFQDENSNGRLDRNWMGMPGEPWCVSRGSRGKLAPPSFAAASFAVNDGVVQLSCRAR